MSTDQLGRRPAIEVLYVQDCPHYPGTLALVSMQAAKVALEGPSRGPAEQWWCRWWRRWRPGSRG
jgi:hypothetical protein